jgi:catechol 2,3-dioxygenase-like lactoylglutathione lyase family enzyme
VIDHVYISVTNIEKSLAFYLEALKPLGWAEFGNYDSASGPGTVPDLYGLGDHTYVTKHRVRARDLGRRLVFQQGDPLASGGGIPGPGLPVLAHERPAARPAHPVKTWLAGLCA